MTRRKRTTPAWDELELRYPRADPPVATDGRCFLCGRERPRVAIDYGDPFCSTECARTWWSPTAIAARGWALAYSTRRQ